MSFVRCSALPVGIVLFCTVCRPTKAQIPADKLFTDNKFDQARTAYTTAVKAAPAQASSRLGLVRTLLRLDAWQDAVTQARAAVTALPKSADAKGLLALALMRAGKPEEAKTLADSALALDPNSYWGMVAAGRAALWNNGSEEASSLLKHATTLHPDWPEAWYYLLATYDEKERPAFYKSLATYRKLNPKGHPHDQATEGLEGALKFAQTLETQSPLKAVGKLDEKTMKAADEGKAAPVSVTFSIERDDEDFIYIPVKVNGSNFSLLFDTGAGDSLSIGRNGGDRLGLPLIAKSIARGVNGKETAKLYKADTLQIGGLTLQTVPFESMENKVGPRDGLIGGAFFQAFMVTVDFEENTMTLTRGKSVTAPAPQPGYRSLTIPFRLESGYIFVPTSIGEKTTWCMLDSGASGISFVSLNLAKQIAAERGKATYTEGKIEGRFGIGASDTQIDVLLFYLSVPIGLMKGDHTPFHVEASPTIAASVMDSEVSSSFDFQIGALVGIKYLSSAKRVTFDYPHHLLTMEFSDGPPAEQF